MNVGLGETSAADRTLPVSVGSDVVDALFAEDMRTGLENHFPFPVCSATAHNLGFVLLEFHPDHFVFSLGVYLQLQFV
jgi:hypothetical protein